LGVGAEAALAFELGEHGEEGAADEADELDQGIGVVEPVALWSVV
jgi:hypothetical protein